MKTLQTISVKGITDNLNKVIVPVCSHAQALGFNDEQVSDIRLAVEEVFVNICSYAYQNSSGEIVIEIIIKDDALLIKIADTGTAFDLTAAHAPELTKELKERGAGGMGIYLTKKVMDHVFYERVGDKNIVVLTKRRA